MLMVGISFAINIASAGIFMAVLTLTFGFSTTFVVISLSSLFFAAAIALHVFGSRDQVVANATNLTAADSKASSTCATELQCSTSSPAASTIASCPQPESPLVAEVAEHIQMAPKVSCYAQLYC